MSCSNTKKPTSSPDIRFPLPSQFASDNIACSMLFGIILSYTSVFNSYFNENFKIENDNVLDIYHCTDDDILNMYHRKNNFCEYCREPIEGNKYSTSKKEKSEWM